MSDGFNEIAESYKPELYKPDVFFLQAKEDIKSLYEEDRGKVFYIRQLQVKFEKKYFHWITYNAIKSLISEKYLKSVPVPVTSSGTEIQFLVHYSNRYPKRDINESTKIIVEYSQDNITRSCGHRAEDLFALALAGRRFIPVNKKVKEYKDKIWTKSDHDLDYVFENKEDGISYGCEIKNTLGYIEKEELEIKLEICNTLSIRPLFILRYPPKTYIELVRQAGGYVMVFVCQIYELSQDKLVKKIREKIGLPVDAPKAIPEGIINRFEKWHKRSLNQ
ncbi:MAG: hypothetical protein KKE64_08085 [Candidatus Omnitrophica bacterium]|nr:hypothetical protein [Candidatus Omnitrophota bacterium]